MKAIDYNNALSEFIVYQDGEYDPELSRRLSFWEKVKYATVLQIEMAIYDLRHGTNYRQVRNQLVREKRNREFEERIGLVKIDT